jgi:hypothetical protein
LNGLKISYLLKDLIVTKQRITPVSLIALWNIVVTIEQNRCVSQMTASVYGRLQSREKINVSILIEIRSGNQLLSDVPLNVLVRYQAMGTNDGIQLMLNFFLNVWVSAHKHEEPIKSVGRRFTTTDEKFSNNVGQVGI